MKSTRWKLLAAACYAASSLVGAPACAAELAGATLDVENAAGAESCPGAEELERQTLALGVPPNESAEPLAIAVSFRATEAEFLAEIRTTGRTTGTRQLSAAGPSCAPLARATAVLLAVLLDLRPREAPAPAPLVASRVTAPPPSRPQPWRYLALGAHADATVGLLGPAFSMAFGGGARVRRTRFELGLSGFSLLNRRVELLPGSVEVDLWGGSLSLCTYFARSGPLEVAGCASLLAGRFHGAGSGYPTNRERASLWLAGGIGATIALELSQHWALRAGMDLAVPFQQYRPEIELVGNAYQASPVGAFLGFGPELRFP